MTDLNTGEFYPIDELFERYKEHIRDMLKTTANFSSYAQQKRITIIYNNQCKKLRAKELSAKLDNDTITLEDIEEWKTLMSKKERSKFLSIEYGDDNSITINKSKPKPKDLCRNDYSRFFELLYIMEDNNKLEDKRGVMSRNTLKEALEFNHIKSLDKFISNLKRHNMLIRTEKNSKNISFIIINPVYAMRNSTIDQTLYKYFKEDLDELLSPLEIKYIELKSNISNNSSMYTIGVKD